MISSDDYSRLASLAKATLARYPADDAQLLLDELHRADVLPSHSISERVVGMNSFVEFRDETTGNTRVLQLVFPYQADIRGGRLSVLSQIGAALIGLAEGQSITWETRDGRERRITVLRVSKKPFDERRLRPAGAMLRRNPQPPDGGRAIIYQRGRSATQPDAAGLTSGYSNSNRANARCSIR